VGSDGPAVWWSLLGLVAVHRESGARACLSPVRPDNDGVWVGGNPLVVCDVAEHAFEKDYPRREDYVAKFLDHVDWAEISRRYKAVDRK
jgi:superoxide dismutase